MFNTLNRTRKRAELSRNAMSEIQNVQQSEIQNVHKPKPSDMWTMYCIARYTDKGACSGQQRGL